jgi:uncharacterized protein (TIGR03067 family)
MLVLIGALTAVAAAPPEENIRREQELLERNWRMVSIEFDGARMPAEEVRSCSLSFKSGKFSSRMGERQTNGTYHIDPAKTPKSMDIVHTDGPEKDKKWALIYSLEGDTLRICGPTEVGRDRPTGFDAKGGIGIILMVLRRE